MVRGRRFRTFAGSVLGVALLMLPACGNDEETPAQGGTTAGGATTVDVTLQEFGVLPSTATAPTGPITFNATNKGPDDDHELVVIRTDLDIDSLPTKQDGSVDEEGEGIEAIDEIPEFPPGTSEQLTVTLESGAYALICNVVQKEADGTIEAHYQEGMRAAFTVS